jgi:hypothetical protein
VITSASQGCPYTRHERIVVLIIGRIGMVVVVENAVIIIVLPVYSVSLNIFNLLI